MYVLFITLLTTCLYISAASLQIRRLKKGLTPTKTWIIPLTLICHALTVFPQSSTSGLSFDLFNAANLIMLVITSITLLMSLRWPVDNLFIILFPLSALTVVLAEIIPIGTLYPLIHSPDLIIHITLSILSYCMLSITAMQALLIMIQNYQLKHKRSSSFIKSFPPLQTMELFFFGFFWAGWILLSLALVSGTVFLTSSLIQHLAHKMILSLVAWFVFAILLWGHHRNGWRGQKAIRWYLIGFSFLVLAYFGSKLVREFILHI